MWKAALVMLIAFVGFIGTTLTWGSTLDGRRDPCAQVPEACATTTSTTTTTTAPATAAPTTTALPTTLPAH